MVYYGSNISENLTKTPEGYLICRNVPIARTGQQEYLGSEIGLTTNDVVVAIRDEAEVFNPSTLASFEGKPFTDGHPIQDLTVDNVGTKMKGVIQNVRRGSNNDSDKIIADIIVYDKQMISKILDGRVREVSCGYSAEYRDNGNGTFSQTKIRGNHLSLVDQGRAGSTVAIKDNDTVVNNNLNIKGGNKMAKKDTFVTKLLRGFVKDENSLSDVVELVEEFYEKTEEVSPAPAVADQEVAPEGEDKFDALVKMVEALAAKVDSLSSATADEDGSNEVEALLEEKETAVDSEAEVIDSEEEIVDSVEGEEEIVETSEEEVSEETKTMDKAMVKKLVKDMRPLIAKLPAEDRKAFNSLIVNNIKDKSTVNGYKNIQKVKDSNTKVNDADPRSLGKRIAEQFNPHYKKEVK